MIKTQIACNVHQVSELVNLPFPGNNGPERRVSCPMIVGSFQSPMGFCVRYEGFQVAAQSVDSAHGLMTKACKNQKYVAACQQRAVDI